MAQLSLAVVTFDDLGVTVASTRYRSGEDDKRHTMVYGSSEGFAPARSMINPSTKLEVLTCIVNINGTDIVPQVETLQDEFFGETEVRAQVKLPPQFQLMKPVLPASTINATRAIALAAITGNLVKVKEKANPAVQETAPLIL